MPAYFVWFKEMDGNSVVKMHGNPPVPITAITIMRGIVAENERTILFNAEKLSRHCKQVSLVKILQMTEEQEAVFGDDLLELP